MTRVVFFRAYLLQRLMCACAAHGVTLLCCYFYRLAQVLTADSNMSKKRSSAIISPFTLSIIVLAFAVFINVYPTDIPSVVGPRAANKPYTTFQEFYPFYHSQHQEKSK